MTLEGRVVVLLDDGSPHAADVARVLTEAGASVAHFSGSSVETAKAMGTDVFGAVDAVVGVPAPTFLGVSHVDLTVRDVAASAAWYQRVFGVRPIMETDEADRSAVVMWHDDAKVAICVGSHLANDGEAFDESRTGLDHLSLRVKDRAALVAWAERLDELGIPYSPIADEAYGSVLVLRDPDNIQLELFANPPR